MTKTQIVLHLLKRQKPKREMDCGDAVASIFGELLERERALLSRIPGDPTVGRLRDKKEKCSTRRGLRVDSGIRSFFKLLKVGFSPYLSFYSHLSALRMFELMKAIRGGWIGLKPWDRITMKF